MNAYTVYIENARIVGKFILALAAISIAFIQPAKADETLVLRLHRLIEPGKGSEACGNYFKGQAGGVIYLETFDVIEREPFPIIIPIPFRFSNKDVKIFISNVPIPTIEARTWHDRTVAMIQISDAERKKSPCLPPPANLVIV